jgi:hypothetical protein
MRGFLIGSLALIVLEVLVQSGPSSKLSQSSNILVAGMKRFLSPGVAGVGNHGANQGTGVATPTTVAPPGPTTRFV